MSDPASPLIIAEDLYEDKIKGNYQTFYFECFSKCPRYPELDQVIKDLKNLLSSTYDFGDKELISRIYEEYSEDSIKCVTMIWTADTCLSKLIKSALIVDSVCTFKLNQKDYQYYYDILESKKTSFRKVIMKSIKFMRLLNTYIVDIGTMFNKKKRTTYRGTRKFVLPNIKPGGTFRIVNWL